MFRTLTSLTALALILSAAPAQAGKFVVNYESEAPGIQNTTATVAGGVETFNSRPTGAGQTFTTDFGTSGKYTGTYKNVQINSADQYGGAGGTGNYPVTFNGTGYSLNLSTKQPGGVNYFGYWLSALDPGNVLDFYSKGKLLFQFNPSDALTAINASPNASAYYGNPNSPWRADSGEPFVFLNFFATGNTTFDKVVFQEVNYGGGYESDNQTIGKWSTMGTGTLVPLISSITSAVPEISTWIMMIAGMGVVGATMRRRRRSALAA